MEANPERIVTDGLCLRDAHAIPDKSVIGSRCSQLAIAKTNDEYVRVIINPL